MVLLVREPVTLDCTPAKVLIWDIETTNLEANFGTILAIGYKYLGLPKVVVRDITEFPGWRSDPSDDSKLVKAIYPVLAGADMWVTYYGEATGGRRGFDEPYIVSKLLEHHLPVLPNIPHVDVYKIARKYLKLHSRRLGVVGEFLGVKTHKTEVLATVWKRARVGHGPSIKYVVDHCQKDVLLLEQVYLRLRAYAWDHPRINGAYPCRKCGGTVQHRGHAITRAKGRQQRVQCASCGGWENRPAKEVYPG